MRENFYPPLSATVRKREKEEMYLGVIILRRREKGRLVDVTSSYSSQRIISAESWERGLSHPHFHVRRFLVSGNSKSLSSPIRFIALSTRK
jgi:hypothetical protein